VFVRAGLWRETVATLHLARYAMHQAGPSVALAGLSAGLELESDRDQELGPPALVDGALSSRNWLISSSERLSGGMFRPRGEGRGQAGRP
jgi:hypothetical protein